ncbi:MAG: RhuM family protein [Candidatus Onthovivens sp.]|nr:RhuM family protein [Candidatus Onthovivens sp.]
MATLFDVSADNIGLHIGNILRESELDSSTTEESSVVQIEGGRKVKRRIKIYNLDMIISVGYRVKSQRGVLFRRWANKILKEFLVQGYAINEKRIAALNKTIEIQSKMLSSSLNIDETSLVNVINEYTKALDLLDDYDHQCVLKPNEEKLSID